MVNQARCRPRSPVCVESRPRAGDSETTCCMLVGAGGGAAADGGANTLCEHAAAAARAARAARGLWVTYAGTYNMTYMLLLYMCGRIATVLAMSAPALSRAAGEVTLP